MTDSFLNELALDVKADGGRLRLVEAGLAWPALKRGLPRRCRRT